MKREISDRNILDKFVEDFCEALERNVKYIIVSGYVAIAHGMGRGTIDIDIIMERISLEKFRKLHLDLLHAGFECLQSSYYKDIFDYLENNISVRYIRKGEDLPEAELKFAKDELDVLQLATRQKFPFTGLDIWFSSIEMNIAFKEELLKSPKDMEDAKHLRIIYKDQIHETLINDFKKMIKKLRLKDHER